MVLKLLHELVSIFKKGVIVLLLSFTVYGYSVDTVLAQEITVYETPSYQRENFGPSTFAYTLDYADLLTFFGVSSIDRIEIPIRNGFGVTQFNWTCDTDSGLNVTAPATNTGEGFVVAGIVYTWYSFDSTVLTASCGDYTSQNFTYTFRPTDNGNHTGLLDSSTRTTGTTVAYPIQLYYTPAPVFAPLQLEILPTSTTPLDLSASVIEGVQVTGEGIWPLFTLLGIPLAFIIALQLIVFTRRSVMLKDNGKR